MMYRETIAQQQNPPTPITQEQLSFWLPIGGFIAIVVVAWVTLKYRIRQLEEYRQEDHKQLKEWIGYENKLLLKDLHIKFTEQAFQVSRLEEKTDSKNAVIGQIKIDIAANKHQLDSLVTQLKLKNIDIDLAKTITKVLLKRDL